jgi:hypothetical protein
MALSWRSLPLSRVLLVVQLVLLAAQFLLLSTSSGIGLPRWSSRCRCDVHPRHPSTVIKPMKFADPLLALLWRDNQFPPDLDPVVANAVTDSMARDVRAAIIQRYKTNATTELVWREVDPTSTPLLGPSFEVRTTVGGVDTLYQVRRPYAELEITPLDAVHVAIVLSLYNRCQQLAQLASSLAGLYPAAGISLIVADYNSTECAVADVLSDARLPFPWHILPIRGKFSRSGGLNAGCQAARDPHAICLMLDVDMVVPSDFITKARLATLRGRTVYAPVCFAQKNGSLVLDNDPKNGNSL